MKYFLIILILSGLFGSTSVYCQDEQIFINPEIYPEFPGGERELFEFIIENFKLPSDENVVLTKTFFSVNIDTSGIASFDSILKLTEGVNQKKIKQELVRIIKLMPKWKPGTCSGLKVPMKMTIPLRIDIK